MCLCACAHCAVAHQFMAPLASLIWHIVVWFGQSYILHFILLNVFIKLSCNILTWCHGRFHPIYCPAFLCTGWCSGNGNKVKLCRARLVLGLVTTFGGSTIPIFSRVTQPGHPLWVSAMSTGHGFGHHWEETIVLHSSQPCYTGSTAGILAYCILA